MRYKNIDEFKLPSPIDLLKWMIPRIFSNKKLKYTVPTVDKVELDAINNCKADLQITWLGHATFLIQANGVNIITDPVFEKMVGSSKRITSSKEFPENLPNIDYVLISHGHYDHLNFSSIKRLKGEKKFIVPLGIGKILKSKGYENFIELNWYESYKDENVEFDFVPARHWHRRSIFDTNKCLWGGFVINSKSENSVYFAGDSGYFNEFKNIGNKFNIKYALMPIGCYEPEWFMKSQHMNPEDSIKAFKELNAKIFIPMHYDSYLLADDHPIEALNRLKEEWNRLNLSEDIIKILKIDETIMEM